MVVAIDQIKVLVSLLEIVVLYLQEGYLEKEIKTDFDAKRIDKNLIVNSLQEISYQTYSLENYEAEKEGIFDLLVVKEVIKVNDLGIDDIIKVVEVVVSSTY